MARKSENHYLVNIPYHSIDDIEFWQQEIEAQNNKYNIGKINNNNSSNLGMHLSMSVNEQEKEFLIAFRKLSIPKQAAIINVIETLLVP